MIEVKYVGKNTYIINYINNTTNKLLWRASGVKKNNVFKLVSSKQYANNNIPTQEALSVLDMVFSEVKKLGCNMITSLPFSSKSAMLFWANIDVVDFYDVDNNPLTNKQIKELCADVDYVYFDGCVQRPQERVVINIGLGRWFDGYTYKF